MGFEPTTLRDLVGCSNHLSYWRLYGEQGPICGSRLEPHHAATQPSNDRHTRSEELTNSIALKSGSWKAKILKSAKILNSRFWKAKILKSSKILKSGLLVCPKLFLL